MKILVTGATGFIGSAFCRMAIQEGHSVAGLCRSASATSGNSHSPLKHPREAQESPIIQLRGTLVNPPWDSIQRFQPDVCVHTAWITEPGKYLESPENRLYREWSLDFLRRLAAAGTQQIIALGTCIEYQLGRECLSESRTPLVPATTYARAKHELHKSLRNALGNEDVRLTWARIFYPYGVGEHPQRLCSSLIQRLNRNETVTLNTPDSTKDYINVEDIARALLLLAERPVDEAVNVGTGVGVTVREVASTVGRILNKPHLIQVAERTVEDPLGYVVSDAARLRSLGWCPKVSLEEGLTRLAAHLSQ